MILACFPDVGALLFLIAVFVILPLVAIPAVSAVAIRWGIRAMTCTMQSGSLAGQPASLLGATLLVPSFFWLIAGSVLLHHVTPGLDATIPFIAILLLLFLMVLLIFVNEPEREQPSGPVAIAQGLVWLQDLLIAAVGIGAWLTVARFLLNFTPDDFLQFTAFILAASAGSLALIIDLGRHTELGRTPLARAGVFGLIFLLMPPLFPAFALTWWMWRKARKRVAKAQMKLAVERNRVGAMQEA